MSKKKAPPKLTAADCVEALRKKFSAPAFALLEQVANGTGFDVSNWADAIAMSLWPSRGLRIHGFEIKVSRSDWTRELKNPGKSVAVQEHCDHWWIVAPARMIDPKELPPTWGLIGVSDAHVARVAVQAPALEHEDDLDRSFVAAVLRRAAEVHDAIVTRERNRAKQQAAVPNQGDLLYQVREFERLKERVEKFQADSGLRVSDWSGKSIGEAVRVVMDAERLGGLALQVERQLRSYESMVSKMQCLLDDLRNIEKDQQKGSNQ